MTWILAFVIACCLKIAALVFVIRYKQLHLWLPAYLAGCWRGNPRVEGPIDIMVCFADHYEPGWSGAELAVQRERVARWVRDYPALADSHRDSDGVKPQWTFFYPAEEYVPEHLDALARLCHAGYGDVEVHLHHRDATSDSLRRQLTWFSHTLAARHGLLRRSPTTGAIRYGFIHGNWALDNSGPHGDWCGVNDELTVLRDTGCYADFTFPSAPSPTQPRQINSIYYATDDRQAPKSHDRGRPAMARVAPSGDLLMVQGPLTLDWRKRSRGVFPRIENGELSADNPPSPHRADTWVRQHVHVEGRPNWVFIKLHTHGANERNTPVLHGREMHDTLRHLERRYNDGVRYRLHYVSAWETYNIICAAEAGADGNPNAYRRLNDSPVASARAGGSSRRPA